MQFTSNLPSKSQIFEYWKDRLEKLGFFIDWGEPECWACGFHYNGKYDITRSNASWKKVLAGWDKIPLQRCHIVPRSLGGPDKVSNLFLMCRECHDLAPNTNISEVFFEWTRSQSSWVRESAKINAALDSFGIEDADLDILSDLIRSKEFNFWMRDKFGLHWPQSNYAPRSSRFTSATMIGLAVYYRRAHPERA